MKAVVQFQRTPHDYDPVICVPPMGGCRSAATAVTGEWPASWRRSGLITHRMDAPLLAASVTHPLCYRCRLLAARNRIFRAQVTGFAPSASAADRSRSFSLAVSGIFMLAVLRSSGCLGGRPLMPLSSTHKKNAVKAHFAHWPSNYTGYNKCGGWT